MSLKQVFLDIFSGGETVIARQSRAMAAELRGARTAKPRIAVVNHAPSREEFAAWRGDPVTQFVFAAMRAAREAQQVMWTNASWGSGSADPLALAELRARADAYASLEEGSYEAFCEWAGVGPDA